VISLTDIKKAQRETRSYLIKTPVLPQPTLGKKLNVSLYFKAEIFQKTGSFKPRGSLNKLLHLTEKEKENGIITVSSGNHAQGVAYAASVFGVRATVVMHQDTSKLKIESTRNFGAEVILTEGNPFDTCSRLQRKRNLTFLHPFDDPHIAAGHGTLGLEILDQYPQVDVIFVPIGGGGLISGVATAIKLKKATVKVVGVEPLGASAMLQSLQKGKVVCLNETQTMAAGLAPPFVGEMNLAIVQKYVDDVVLVSDEAIVEALWTVLEHSKILTEPSGVASFAGFLSYKGNIPSGSEVVCILSGGNIDRHDLRLLPARL
jgi:threonine dehydratase